MTLTLILIVFAYLLGSINSAIVICKLMGLPSPREMGSGNPGATNVLRLGNKKAAGFTLVGDVLKGIIPVLIGHAAHVPSSALGWIALAAVIGHIFPVFFHFKGGKGVATAIGAIFAINFFVGLAVGVSWLIIAGLFRFSSLASIIAIVLAPLYSTILIDHRITVPLCIMAIVIVIRHKSNIKRIIQGNESKIGSKKKSK